MLEPGAKITDKQITKRAGSGDGHGNDNNDNDNDNTSSNNNENDNDIIQPAGLTRELPFKMRV